MFMHHCEGTRHGSVGTQSDDRADETDQSGMPQPEATPPPQVQRLQPLLPMIPVPPASFMHGAMAAAAAAVMWHRMTAGLGGGLCHAANDAAEPTGTTASATSPLHSQTCTQAPDAPCAHNARAPSEDCQHGSRLRKPATPRVPLGGLDSNLSATAPLAPCRDAHAHPYSYASPRTCDPLLPSPASSIWTAYRGASCDGCATRETSPDPRIPFPYDTSLQETAADASHASLTLTPCAAAPCLQDAVVRPPPPASFFPSSPQQAPAEGSKYCYDPYSYVHPVRWYAPK